MTDSLTAKQRSRNMAAIRWKDTKPELTVRRYLHRRGYRYSLHRKALPGRPDIVLPKWNTLIFVNGCYWHRHRGCALASTPKSNVSFWEAKFKGNVERDKNNLEALAILGWKVITVWECEVRNNSFTEWIESKIQE